MMALQKIQRRVNEQGIRGLPGWAANWLYWKGKLYRVPAMPRVRAELKYRRSRKKFNIDTPIIVYQMGKVGSSSVYDALRDLDLDVPVYHAHVLNRFEVYEEGVRRTRIDPTGNLAALREGRALRNLVDSARWQKWALVSLVRAPIPRALSDFFENVDAYVPNFWERWKNNEIGVAELNETFWARFQDTSMIHWFDDQVRDVFGIDVFATPFPHAQGYAMYENERARLLLIRLENLNASVGDAMRAFLGLPHFQLSQKNIGSEKPYGALYREFLAQLRLPREYINATDATRYARHFYNESELAASVARWV